VALLQGATKTTSSELGEIEPHTVQSCYLPITNGGVPMVGPIPGIQGAYVATGHSCWGITNGPATGEAMADLIMEDSDSAPASSDAVDLRPFYPKSIS
jgi:glycine/D-amino acid oxidase-like deaminating enzyme